MPRLSMISRSCLDRVCLVSRGSVFFPALARRPEPRPPAANPLRPYLDRLKSAIADTGLSDYAVARRSGISRATITRFMYGDHNLNFMTAMELAECLMLDLGPAESQATPSDTTTPDEVTPPWPSGTCPIAWGADGSPIIRGNSKRATTAQLRVIRALYDAGPRGLSGDELKVHSGRGGYRLILKTLAKDEDWAAVIREAGGPRGRYRLAKPTTN